MKRSTGSTDEAPSCCSGWPAYGPPLIAHAPTAITIFGGGTASYVFCSASRMFSVTGPVMRRPAAWRGEATQLLPNRPRSQPIVPRTLTSALQALQSPALTTRSFSERPNSRRSFRSSASASGSACPVRTRSSRRRAASRKSCVNAIAPVGQTSAHARHPSGHFAGSRMGAPRYRSGIGGGSPAGYAIVRCPWCARASSAFSMKSPSQVVAAIGEVEALVAQREIRDLAAPHREGDPQPVVEGRIGDLVAREAAGRVRHRDVADFPAPAFRERHNERVRSHCPGFGTGSPRRKLVELLEDERDRLLDLEPADVGAGIDVPMMGRHHGKVDETIDARGKVVPHVPLDAARARRRPDKTHGFRVLRRDGSRLVEPLPHARRLPEKLHRFRDLAARYGDSGLQILDLRGEEVESDAAGPDETAPESRAADLRRHVQEISALASAIRRGREIRDVARQGSEVADVVREPFELERDAANRVGARGDRRVG